MMKLHSSKRTKYPSYHDMLTEVNRQGVEVLTEKTPKGYKAFLWDKYGNIKHGKKIYESHYQAVLNTLMVLWDKKQQK